MYLAKMSPEVSNATGYSIGILSSYILNKNYTFRNMQSNYGEFFRFLNVIIFTYVLNLIFLMIFIYKFNIHEGLSQILAGIIYTIISYFLNKSYVFDNKKIS